jgi:hypothetical protein
VASLPKESGRTKLMIVEIITSFAAGVYQKDPASSPSCENTVERAIIVSYEKFLLFAGKYSVGVSDQYDGLVCAHLFYFS